MEYGEAVKEFEEFFSDEMYSKVADAVQNGEPSVVVDIQELDVFNPELLEYLRNDPYSAIGAAEEGVLGVDIISDETFNVRFTNMLEEDFIILRNLRSDHLGKFIPVEGMIKRASQVKPEVVSAVFECTQCGDRYEKEQDSSKLKSPYKCDCGSRKFEVVEKKMTDTQMIALEENPEARQGSEQPTTLSVRLEGDLVDPDFQKKIIPGNIVDITGVLQERPLKNKSKKYDIYMNANYVEPKEQEFEELELTDEEGNEILELAQDPEIFDKISRSIAPSIFGHHQIKKAIALQLFGGVRKTREDGIKSRGDIHILLIGEPGTGKSQMLKFTGELSPKGRYVVGKSSTGAGLCVTGDTLIHTTDGFKEIGETGRKEIPFKTDKETAKEHRKEIYTFEEGEIKRKNSSLVWRMPEKKCI
jgi:replicative DNA helicase Mcm